MRVLLLLYNGLQRIQFVLAVRTEGAGHNAKESVWKPQRESIFFISV